MWINILLDLILFSERVKKESKVGVQVKRWGIKSYSIFYSLKLIRIKSNWANVCYLEYFYRLYPLFSNLSFLLNFYLVHPTLSFSVALSLLHSLQLKHTHVILTPLYTISCIGWSDNSWTIKRSRCVLRPWVEPCQEKEKKWWPVRIIGIKR